MFFPVAHDTVPEAFALTIDGEKMPFKTHSKWYGDLERWSGYEWPMFFNSGQEHRVEAHLITHLPELAHTASFVFYLGGDGGDDYPALAYGLIGKEIVHVVADKGLSLSVDDHKGVPPNDIEKYYNTANPKVINGNEITWEINNTAPKVFDLVIKSDGQ